MVVECNNVIPAEKQDKQLLDKMYAEREGIVQKCVKALQTVINNGYKFSEPESVIAARSEYQATNSTVITFFQECMCHWPGGKIGGSTITTGKIHKTYVLWCRNNNNGYSKSMKEFRDELASHLDSTFADMTTRIHGNTYYKEWTLTEDIQDDYEPLSWVKGWNSSGMMLPYNGETGRNYNGVNRFVLLLKAMEQSWSDPRYYTFHQVNQMEGCHVRAGEKATGVEYWLLFKSHYEKIMAVNKDAMAGV